MTTESERKTNITADIREQFDALVSGDYSNFALFSCYVDGEPSAAIVAVSEDQGEYTVHPLFVAVTPGMMLTDHDGEEPAWKDEHGS